jgi:hypothetical protein
VGGRGTDEDEGGREEEREVVVVVMVVRGRSAEVVHCTGGRTRRASLPTRPARKINIDIDESRIPVCQINRKRFQYHISSKMFCREYYFTLTHTKPNTANFASKHFLSLRPVRVA